MQPGGAGRLLVFVRLSSERVRQAVRDDCSFANKQASPVALLVVVRCERVGPGNEDGSIRAEA